MSVAGTWQATVPGAPRAFSPENHPFGEAARVAPDAPDSLPCTALIMSRNRVFLWCGLGCLVVGGVLLALAGEAGTIWGTTLGLAGVGLCGWAWAKSR